MRMKDERVERTLIKPDVQPGDMVRGEYSGDWYLVLNDEAVLNLTNYLVSNKMSILQYDAHVKKDKITLTIEGDK